MLIAQDAVLARWRALALLPLLSSANGFVLMPSNVTSKTNGDLTKLSRFVYRWTTPEDSGSNDGLGGGLSWVLDPSFCDQMLPRFPEGEASWNPNSTPTPTLTPPQP